MPQYSVKFNKKAYEGKSKADFVKAEKHHEELGVDLSKEYDKMFPAPEKSEKPEKEKV